MSKFVSDEGEMTLIKNDDLICKNCIYKSKNAATCVAYEDGKPLEVVENNKCKFFKKTINQVLTKK